MATATSSPDAQFKAFIAAFLPIDLGPYRATADHSRHGDGPPLAVSTLYGIRPDSVVKPAFAVGSLCDDES
jgi:hypothetical protein